MTDDKTPTIIGRAGKVDLPDLGFFGVPAKTDTGADSSSIWAGSVTEKPDGLHCVFFGPASEFYTGETHIFVKDYSITRVANSFGHKELRYKLKLRIRVGGRLIRGSFTLSDRSSKIYPVLIGRRLLKGKFVVDVTQGEPLHEAEKTKAKRLRAELDKLTRKEKTS